MIRLRPYREQDSIAAGVLIAENLSEYTLDPIPQTEKALYLGPFIHAHSTEIAHQRQMAMFIQDTIVFVAENEEGRITGLLRGRPGRLHDLYVEDWYFFQDTGRKLVEKFEQSCQDLGSKKINLAAPLFTVAFYLRMGYKKSTGIRKTTLHGKPGLLCQPMKKKLA